MNTERDQPVEEFSQFLFPEHDQTSFCFCCIVFWLKNIRFYFFRYFLNKCIQWGTFQETVLLVRVEFYSSSSEKFVRDFIQRGKNRRAQFGLSCHGHMAQRLWQ
jgi:hypothetical protein